MEGYKSRRSVIKKFHSDMKLHASLSIQDIFYIVFSLYNEWKHLRKSFLVVSHANITGANLMAIGNEHKCFVFIYSCLFITILHNDSFAHAKLLVITGEGPITDQGGC